MMTKNIKIPTTYDKEFHIGVNLFNEEKYKAAIPHFEKAYQLNQSYDIHRLLVICYMEAKEYQHAKEILKERYNDYISSHEGRMIYMELLKHTHEFVTTDMFIQDFQTIDPELSHALEFLQRDAEYLYAYHQKAYQDIIEQLRYLERYHYIEQYQILKHAYYLPVKYFRETVIPLLMQKKINIMIRSTLLEDLARLRCHRDVDYLLFNGEVITVIPATLQGIINSKSYVQLEAQIEIELAHQPDIKAILLKELPLIFAVLYPVPEYFIRNTKRFLNAMLYRYGMNDYKEQG